ncbi:hypothetical protein A71_15 [Escherichia phage A7_1]|nr:hypothetical protein A71_15 [Escherichia phage A7_1]
MKNETWRYGEFGYYFVDSIERDRYFTSGESYEGRLEDWNLFAALFPERAGQVYKLIEQKILRTEEEMKCKMMIRDFSERNESRGATLLQVRTALANLEVNDD